MRNRKDPFSLRLDDEVINQAKELGSKWEHETSWALRKLIDERIELAEAGLSFNDREAIDGLCLLLKSPGFNQVIKGLKKASKDELNVVRSTFLDLVRKSGLG